MLLNGVVHVAQDIAFVILASVLPVTYSIASLFNRIAIMCITLVWFNQNVHPIQSVGTALTLLWLCFTTMPRGKSPALRHAGLVSGQCTAHGHACTAEFISKMLQICQQHQLPGPWRRARNCEALRPKVPRVRTRTTRQRKTFFVEPLLGDSDIQPQRRNTWRAREI